MQIINRQLLLKRKMQSRVSGAQALKDNQFLLENAQMDLLERLKLVIRDFDIAVHLGGYNGSFARMAKPYKIASHCFTIENLSSNAQDIIADDEILPLKHNAVNLVTSSLSMQFVNDLPGVLAQIKNCLKPDGLFIANLIGGTSLYELRTSFLQAEAELTGGASPRILPFIDVQQMGSLLQRAGFALPVVDMDSLSVKYNTMFDLIKDLRAMGATNCLLSARDAKPLTRTVIARAAEIYSEQFANDTGRISAQFDIMNIIGWSPHESQQKPLKPGSATNKLADFL